MRPGAATTLDVADAGERQRASMAVGLDVRSAMTVNRDQQILDALAGLAHLIHGTTAPPAADDTSGPGQATIPAIVRRDLAALVEAVRAISGDVRALRLNFAIASLPVRGGGGANGDGAWPVNAAEAATDTILDAVDRIDNAVNHYAGERSDKAGSDLAAVVDGETVRIIEACNAQDVVLRRLHRVVESIVALEPVLERLATAADSLEPQDH